MKTIIIEDEINAFEYLQTILKKLKPNLNVLCQLESVEDSVNWLHQNEHPDLIFMDIQLSDGLSFEIFKHVPIQCPIIFTTAYDQYAIDAFKVNSIDYLLKPIHINDLEKALDKFARQHQIKSNLSAKLDEVFQRLNTNKKHRCLIKKGNHFEFINISDIAYVNSSDGLTFLYTYQGKQHLYTNTIEGFFALLDSAVFFQINRGQIININAIQRIHPYFNQRMKVELQIPTKDIDLIVSRSKVPSFKTWIDQ